MCVSAVLVTVASVFCGWMPPAQVECVCTSSLGLLLRV